MDQTGQKIFYTKIAKRLAVYIVARLIGRGLIPTDMQNEAVELLLECLVEGVPVLVVGIWAWFDAKKTKQAIEVSERKVEVALDSPAGTPKEEVEAHVEREQKVGVQLPVNPTGRPTNPGMQSQFVDGKYDRKTGRFFPDHPEEEGKL